MTRIAQVHSTDGWPLEEWLLIRDGITEATIHNYRDGIVLEGKESPEALAFIAELQAKNRAAVAPPVPAETPRLGAGRVPPSFLAGFRMVPRKRA